MSPFTIRIHNTNAMSSPSTNKISLTHFLENNFQSPIQSSFNRHARRSSLLANIFLWLAFLFAIAVLRIDKDELNTAVRIIYGLLMLLIIITCYVFILFESKGCTEQILLQKRVQIDTIKRELGLIQKNPKLGNYLSVTATNYYNSFERQYIDYQQYDKSLYERLQSFLYRHIRLIDTPFNIRQCYIDIPDFSIDNNRLCQISFKTNLSIIGRDAEIVHDDIKQEFQRLETKLLHSTNDNQTDINSMNKLARIEQHIYFQFSDVKQQDLLLGQRRTCLVYEDKMKIYCRWFLTENIFWIMTCIGLSWIFRAIFACLITKIIVPIYIEIEGAMPLPLTTIDEEKNISKEKLSNRT